MRMQIAIGSIMDLMKNQQSRLGIWWGGLFLGITLVKLWGTEMNGRKKIIGALILRKKIAHAKTSSGARFKLCNEIDWIIN